jgi:(p)ppGpp synthase/HD superfamily hydrolase
MSPKNYLPLIVLLLSAAGILVCAWGFFAVWSFGSRLNRTTEFVFAGVDKSLVTVGDRVLQTQQHAHEWKITAEHLQQALRERTGKKVAQLAESRLNIQEDGQRLGEGLQQADAWLEMSTAAVQNVGQSLEILQSLGAPAPGNFVEALLEKLNGLRTNVQNASKTVSEIRQRAADLAAGPSQAELREQLAQFAARLLVTLGDVDSQLAGLAARFDALQTNAESLQSQTQQRIAIAKFALIALLIWLAVGQVSLCVRGWRSYRCNQPAA